MADVGTAVLPWLSDHQVHSVAAFPGAAYCEMALAAAGAVFGEAAGVFEVRDIAFEQMLLLDDQTPIDAVASVEASGVVDFVVETHQDGENTRHATAALHATEDDPPPPSYDMAALLAAHPCLVNGTELRESLVERGVQLGPAFAGLAAAHIAEAGVSTVLAEVGLPGSIRFQQAAYRVHPALLDACFQSVAAHRGVEATGSGGLLLPLGVRRIRAYGPTRNARYCYTRVTRADPTGGEADLDVLDEQGTVLLTVRGLRMGTGTSETGERERVLSERLLTLDWQQRTLPEDAHGLSRTEAGSWLLIDTSDAADLLATTLTDALKSQGAQCANLHWSREADAAANLERLGSHLRARPVDGVVILCGARAGDPDEQSLLRGREQVRHLVRIARELAELEGELPRLFVVTRQAQTVRSHDSDDGSTWSRPGCVACCG